MFDKKIYVAGSIAIATFIYVLWGPTKRKSKKRGKNTRISFIFLLSRSISDHLFITNQELWKCEGHKEEWTGAGVVWLTSVPEVLGSILNWAPFVVALSKSHFHSSGGIGQKLSDSYFKKKK